MKIATITLNFTFVQTTYLSLVFRFPILRIREFTTGKRFDSP